MELNHNQRPARIDHHQGEYWQTSNFYVLQVADIAHADILLKDKEVLDLEPQILYFLNILKQRNKSSNSSTSNYVFA